MQTAWGVACNAVEGFFMPFGPQLEQRVPGEHVSCIQGCQNASQIAKSIEVPTSFATLNQLSASAQYQSKLYVPQVITTQRETLESLIHLSHSLVLLKNRNVDSDRPTRWWPRQSCWTECIYMDWLHSFHGIRWSQSVQPDQTHAQYVVGWLVYPNNLGTIHPKWPRIMVH